MTPTDRNGMEIRVGDILLSSNNFNIFRYKVTSISEDTVEVVSEIIRQDGHIGWGTIFGFSYEGCKGMAIEGFDDPKTFIDRKLPI